MGWKHYQTVDPPKTETQVGRRLSCVHPTNSSLQILDFQIHQIFNISYFPQFYLSFEKEKISSPKCPQITQKFTKNCQTVVNEIRTDLALLET